MKRRVVWETVHETERRPVPVCKRVRDRNGVVRDAVIFEPRDLTVEKHIKKIVEEE